MKDRKPKRIFISTLVLAIAGWLQACNHIDIKQATYGALRSHDCRAKNLAQICTHTYRREYVEYSRIREEIMREHHDQIIDKPLASTQAKPLVTGVQ